VTILIGYVDTPEGEAALETGLAEARLRGTDVIVVNSPRRGAPVDDDMISGAQIERILQRAKELDVPAEVRQPLHRDDLPRTLEDLASQTGAELLVIGLRHRSPVGKLILGSDAQRILLEADVPVLAVKA
jgi:nucleotide-binding universal stress UspA family protein